MIARPFDEVAIYGNWNGYANWKAKATAAKLKAAARATGQDYEFDSTIWRDLKEHLLAFFFGKCAYCEVKITAGFWGDVEHYRPKKKVTEDPAHPGYYWLAYDVRNLMPSCQRCNQGSGKANHFPIAGTRMSTENDADQENPLLLNPYIHDPAKHLEFFFGPEGQPTGIIRPRTESGRVSIEVYRLQRPELTDERREAQENAVLAMKTHIQEKTVGDYIASLIQGRRPYSAAALAAALAWWREYKRRTDAEIAAAIDG
jgi:uncharacterized protein (TIGR02646 family)